MRQTTLWTTTRPILLRFGMLGLGGLLFLFALCYLPPLNNFIGCLKVQAYLGSTTAMLKLVEIDGGKRYYWLLMAAEHRNTQAIFGVGNLNRPTPEALVWYKKGAELGSVGCMIEVSKAYEYGLYGAPIDKSEANRWLQLIKIKIASEKRKRGGW